MADNTNRYSTYSPQDRSLRASDHDREAIGDFLRRQHVVGRLDADEYADRYGAASRPRPMPSSTA